MTDDRYRNEHADKPTFEPIEIPKLHEEQVRDLAEEALAANAAVGLLPWTYSDRACSLTFAASTDDAERIMACLLMCEGLPTAMLTGLRAAQYKMDFRAP